MMMHSIPAPLAVVPILVGPLQALLTLLPYIMLGFVGLMTTIVMAIFRPWKIVRFVWTQKVALLIVGAIGVGIWFLFSHVLISKAHVPVAVAVIDKGAGWPAWRGGLDRRAWTPAPGVEDPTTGGFNWTFVDGSYKSFLSSPAVVGNRVYAVSSDKGPLKDQSYIYSLDADTGAVVWKYAPAKYRATFSSPAVSGKYLAIGEGTHWTRDARIVCLDVEASEKQRQGVELWEYRAHWHVESSPCIAEGKVCVGAASDGVYCFAVEGDGKGGPKLLWRLDAKDFPDVESSPLIANGRVYFGQGREGGQAIVCVNAEDGALIWRIKTPYSVFGAPALADGKLYIGMGVGDFVNDAAKLQADARDEMTKQGKSKAEIDAAVAALAAAGEVWCVDLKADKPDKALWTYHVPQTILGAVAVADKKVYFTSLDGNLYCLGTEGATQGKLIGKWDSRSSIQASPAVAAEHVYLATESGQLFALDKETLKPVWQVALGASVLSSPAVARGHVYVGTGNLNSMQNGLVCVGEPAKPAAQVWAGERGGPGQSGWVRGSLLGDRGKFLWRYGVQADANADDTAPGAPVAATVSAAPAFIGDNGYVGVNDKDRHGLVCLDMSKSGGSAAPKERWFCASSNGVYLPVAADEHQAYFVDGRQGDAKRQLHVVDAATGKDRGWNIPVVSAASGQFVLIGRYLVIADQGDGLSCFDLGDNSVHAPGLVWKQTVGSVVGTPMAVGNLLIVAAGKPQFRLVAVDLPTGAVLWDVNLGANPTTGPVVVNDAIWLGLGNPPVGGDWRWGFGDVFEFDLADGHLRQVVAGGPVTTALTVDGNRLAAVNDRGEIVVIDTRAGGAGPIKIAGEAGVAGDKTRSEDAAAGKETHAYTAPVVLHDDLLVYFAGGNIRTCKLPALPALPGVPGVPAAVTATNLNEKSAPVTVLPAAANLASKAWLAADWLGKPLSPMVVRGSQLYYATDKSGLVCAGTPGTPGASGSAGAKE